MDDTEGLDFLCNKRFRMSRFAQKEDAGENINERSFESF
jgi:hypothetical protein